jgi:hypothetical protein
MENILKGWRPLLQVVVGFHGLKNVKVSGQVSADVKAARKFPEWLQKVIDEGPYLLDQIV